MWFSDLTHNKVRRVGLDGTAVGAVSSLRIADA